MNATDSSSSSCSEVPPQTEVANTKQKRVSWTDYVEINEFEPINPDFKSNLYYSKKEIYLIQRSLKQAVALRRQRLLEEKLEQELRGNEAFLECLKRHATLQVKRGLEEAQDSPAPAIKRQRILSC